MKAENLKTKTEDELKKLLLDLRKDQFNQRFQKSGGTLENTAEMRKTRRGIARVKTFLSQKGVTVQEPKDKKPAAPKKEAAKKPAAKKTTKKSAGKAA